MNHEGSIVAEGLKFALIVSRFNNLITDRLLEGAKDCILKSGGSRESIDVIFVPGAFEIPLAAKKIALTKKYDAMVCLGCVIKGSTPHFNYIASCAVNGVAEISREYVLPIGFGILTVNTVEQAVERAGTKLGNKGWEAASSAIEMAQLLKKI